MEPIGTDSMEQQAAAPPRPAGIGQKTVSGIAWLTADVVFAKLGNSLTQLVLAYLLAPSEFGVFALALSVVVISEFVSRSGLRDILIRQHKDYDEIGGTATWMALALGIASSAVVYALAGPAARYWESPAVEGVLKLAALAPIINGIGIVPRSRLESMFRFRAITMVGWGAVIARAATALTLASMGFGVYALVWALLAANAVNAFTFLFLSHQPASLRPRLSVAKGLLGDMSLLFWAGLMTALVSQGDYFLMGKFADDREVGLYYIAFSLSIQVVMMFAMNLNRVMMPALSHLADDPLRQRSAFLEAARGLMLVGAPICLLQAGLAWAVMGALYPAEYRGAALPMSILLAGMNFRLLAYAAVPLIKSQGRFKTHMVLQMLSAVWILGPAGVGAWLAGAWGCALGVAIGSALNGVVMPTVALGEGLAGLPKILGVQLPSLAVGSLSGCSAFAVGLLLPETRLGSIAHLLIGGAVGLGVYAVGTRVLMPRQLRSAMTRTRVLWGRIPVVRSVMTRLMPGGASA